jgi:hypothetical protein
MSAQCLARRLPRFLIMRIGPTAGNLFVGVFVFTSIAFLTQINISRRYSS